MTRHRGRHRAPSTIDLGATGRTLARTALAGAVAGGPLVVAAPALAASGAAWDKLAECESGGNWSINTGNGYSGGLQFHPQTWRGFGGGEFAAAAHQASRAEQIVVAERVLAKQGWNAWPACSKKMGLRGESATPRSAPAAEKPVSKRPAAKKPVAKRPAAEAAVKPEPQRVRASAPSTGGPYVVRPGDTLAEIAAANGVRGGWQTLAAKNPALDDPNLIFPGQRLAM